MAISVGGRRTRAGASTGRAFEQERKKKTRFD